MSRLRSHTELPEPASVLLAAWAALLGGAAVSTVTHSFVFARSLLASGGGLKVGGTVRAAPLPGEVWKLSLMARLLLRAVIKKRLL